MIITYIILVLPYLFAEVTYLIGGKEMKLSKTIIVTGILFSSILGGVNVNSITAMASNIGVDITKP